MQPIPRSPAVNFYENIENYIPPRPMTRRERTNNIYEWHIQQLTPAEQAQYQRWETECREAHRIKVVTMIRKKQFAHLFK
jgi:hypothetical protein